MLEHLGRLETELARTRTAVISLRRLLAPEPPPLQVEMRAEPAVMVAAVEDEVGEDDVVAWYAGAMAELDAVLGPAPNTLNRPAASTTMRSSNVAAGSCCSTGPPPTRLPAGACTR